MRLRNKLSNTALIPAVLFGVTACVNTQDQAYNGQTLPTSTMVATASAEPMPFPEGDSGGGTGEGGGRQALQRGLFDRHPERPEQGEAPDQREAHRQQRHDGQRGRQRQAGGRLQQPHLRRATNRGARQVEHERVVARIGAMFAQIGNASPAQRMHARRGVIFGAFVRGRDPDAAAIATTATACHAGRSQPPADSHSESCVSPVCP